MQKKVRATLTPPWNLVASRLSGDDLLICINLGGFVAEITPHLDLEPGAFGNEDPRTIRIRHRSDIRALRELFEMPKEKHRELEVELLPDF